MNKAFNTKKSPLNSKFKKVRKAFTSCMTITLKRGVKIYPLGIERDAYVGCAIGLTYLRGDI